MKGVYFDQKKVICWVLGLAEIFVKVDAITHHSLGPIYDFGCLFDFVGVINRSIGVVC